MSSTEPGTASNKEYFNASTFIVEVDGVQIGRFTQLSGLSIEIEVEEFVEGGESGFAHKLPGRMKYPNLVLKRGITHDDNLLNWFNDSSGTGAAGRGGKVTRKTAAVTLISATGTRLRTWSLVDAFPTKWTGPSLSASGAEVAEEELEIAHHGFTSQTF